VNREAFAFTTFCISSRYAGPYWSAARTAFIVSNPDARHPKLDPFLVACQAFNSWTFQWTPGLHKSIICNNFYLRHPQLRNFRGTGGYLHRVVDDKQCCQQYWPSLNNWDCLFKNSYILYWRLWDPIKMWIKRIQFEVSAH
jgi:hypothetical protein